jgi:hypothetical protein
MSGAPAAGAAVERAVAAEYGLDLEGTHRSWADAEYGNGVPVEIKGAAYRRSSGKPGRFRIFEDPHDRLKDHNGWYAFAVYRRRGRGFEVLKSKIVRADNVGPWEWYGAGGHRDSRQIKIPIDDVFG